MKKWGILLTGVVITWILNAWYFLLLAGMLHSWWPLIPVMGFKFAVLLSTIVCVAIVVGRFIGSFFGSVIKDVT